MYRVIWASAILVPLACGGTAWGEPISIDYSGLVRMHGHANTFLVVHDAKWPRDKDKPRLGVLTVGNAKASPAYTEIRVDKWSTEKCPSNDLEGCCRIPGRPHEYLLAESGYDRGRFGRVFHVLIKQTNPGKAWTAMVLGIIRPFLQDKTQCDGERKTHDGSDYATPDGDQVEGVECLQLSSDGSLVLVLGTRGRKQDRVPARLIWGRLRLDAKDDKQAFTRMGEAMILDPSFPFPACNRGCSDLHICREGPPRIEGPPRTEGPAWAVLSVATYDPSDIGPFRSVVYRAGVFRENRKKGTLEFHRDRAPLRLHVLDGLKVEGLAEPAKCVSESTLSVSTDDEDMGGIWRPLRRP